MNGIEIRRVSRLGLEPFAEVIARGMVDNPHHVRDFGRDRAVRARRCLGFYRVVLAHLIDRGQVYAAYRGDQVVGGLAAVGPTGCQVALVDQIRIGLQLIGSLGPGPGLSSIRWLVAREGYDPPSHHWHLGPVAVDDGLQGQGLGSRLMQDFFERVAPTQPGAPVFLETESERNVRFYERFGFAVVARCYVRTVSTWLMSTELRQSSRLAGDAVQ